MRRDDESGVMPRKGNEEIELQRSEEAKGWWLGRSAREM
jgi:hypothetical protein